MCCTAVRCGTPTSDGTQTSAVRNPASACRIGRAAFDRAAKPIAAAAASISNRVERNLTELHIFAHVFYRNNLRLILIDKLTDTQKRRNANGRNILQQRQHNDKHPEVRPSASLAGHIAAEQHVQPAHIDQRNKIHAPSDQYDQHYERQFNAKLVEHEIHQILEHIAQTQIGQIACDCRKDDLWPLRRLAGQETMPFQTQTDDRVQCHQYQIDHVALDHFGEGTAARFVGQHLVQAQPVDGIVARIVDGRIGWWRCGILMES